MKKSLKQSSGKRELEETRNKNWLKQIQRRDTESKKRKNHWSKVREREREREIQERLFKAKQKRYKQDFQEWN